MRSPNAKLLLLTTPLKVLDMLLKLVGDWLSQSLEIIHCAFFALSMSLKLEDETRFNSNYFLLPIGLLGCD